MKQSVPTVMHSTVTELEVISLRPLCRNKHSQLWPPSVFRAGMSERTDGNLAIKLVNENVHFSIFSVRSSFCFLHHRFWKQVGTNSGATASSPQIQVHEFIRARVFFLCCVWNNNAEHWFKTWTLSIISASVLSCSCFERESDLDVKWDNEDVHSNNVISTELELCPSFVLFWLLSGLVDKKHLIFLSYWWMFTHKTWIEEQLAAGTHFNKLSAVLKHHEDVTKRKIQL